MDTEGTTLLEERELLFDFSKTQALLSIATYTVMSIGLVGNLLFLFYLVNNRVGSAASMIFVRAQCLSDVIVCTGVLARTLHTVHFNSALTVPHSPSFIDELICRVWLSATVNFFFGLLSICTIILTSIDRFVAVVFPLVYNRIRNRHRRLAGFGLAFVTLFGALVCIPSLFENIYIPPAPEKEEKSLCIENYRLYNSTVLNTFIRGNAIFWVLFIYIAPVVTIVSLYSAVIYYLRKQQINTGTTSTGLKQVACGKFTLASFLIAAAYVACFSWDSILYSLYITGQIKEYYNTDQALAAQFFIYTNFCLNPLIYLIILDKFRGFLCDRLCSPVNIIFQSCNCFRRSYSNSYELTQLPSEIKNCNE